MGRGPSAWGTEQGTRAPGLLPAGSVGARRCTSHRVQAYAGADPSRTIGAGWARLAVLQAAQGQSKSTPAVHPPRNPEPYVRAALSACHQGSSSHRAASKSSRSQCVGEPASPGLGIAQLLHLCLALLARLFARCMQQAAIACRAIPDWQLIAGQRAASVAPALQGVWDTFPLHRAGLLPFKALGKVLLGVQGLLPFLLRSPLRVSPRLCALRTEGSPLRTEGSPPALTAGGRDAPTPTSLPGYHCAFWGEKRHLSAKTPSPMNAESVAFHCMAGRGLF